MQPQSLPQSHRKMVLDIIEIVLQKYLASMLLYFINLLISIHFMLFYILFFICMNIIVFYLVVIYIQVYLLLILAVKTLQSDFIYGVLQMIDGEKDPRNLIVAFRIFYTTLHEVPGHSRFTEDLVFELILTSIYYTIIVIVL